MHGRLGGRWFLEKGSGVAHNFARTTRLAPADFNPHPTRIRSTPSPPNPTPTTHTWPQRALDPSAHVSLFSLLLHAPRSRTLKTFFACSVPQMSKTSLVHWSQQSLPNGHCPMPKPISNEDLNLLALLFASRPKLRRHCGARPSCMRRSSGCDLHLGGALSAYFHL